MTNRFLPSSFLDRPAARAKQVGGRLCLDFTNSVGGWNLGGDDTRGKRVFSPRDDRLQDYQDLVAWALKAEVVDAYQAATLLKEAAAHPQAATTTWKRALRLRAAIHSIASSLENRASPESDDLDTLARETSSARARLQLWRGPTNLEWRLPKGTLPLDAILGPVAQSAEDCFTRGDLTRLHTCPGEECGWLFEDTTRNRSRRWCDMGDCGNSAKVQTFRARQARRPRTP